MPCEGVVPEETLVMDNSVSTLLTRRRRTPELMDDPSADRSELARSLVFIRAVNRRLGGVHSLRRNRLQFPRPSDPRRNDDLPSR